MAVILLLLSGGLFIGLYQFNRLFFQAQARYLFPGLGAYAILMVAGWAQCWPGLRQVWGVTVWCASLLSLCLVSLNQSLWSTGLPFFR